MYTSVLFEREQSEYKYYWKENKRKKENNVLRYDEEEKGR